MKLCFLTGEYPPMQGGVADHTAHLARHLAQLGLEVHVLTSYKATSDLRSPVSNLSRSKFNAPGRSARPGSATSRIPSRSPGSGRARVTGLQRVTDPLRARKLDLLNLRIHPLITGWGLGCWRQISHWLDEYQPDVLHVQYQAAAFDLGGWVNWLPWWLGRRRSRPQILVTFHDLRVPYLFPKAGPLRWRSILTLARQSDAVITTNVGDREALISSSLAPDRLFLIPLGSNVEVQSPMNYDRGRWRAGMGIDEDTLLLGYFGFLNESKGGEDLILALDQLVQRGYKTHLLMIGGQVGDVDPTNRAYAGRVRSLIQTLGLADRVHWTGHTSPEEVSANLLAADVVVMPYRDGVSFRRTTFIAALRHGRPVVTTYPAIPVAELRDGDNVMLVPVSDVDALSTAIASLADKPELQRCLSNNAQILGRQFDWDKITAQTIEVYRHVLGA